VTPQKISIKEAKSTAADIIQQLYEPIVLQDLLLEEVERGPSNDWYVTMSFTRAGGAQTSQERIHKRLRINAETGEIVSMKDKQFEAGTIEPTENLQAAIT
jgi:hypothetical protein